MLRYVLRRFLLLIPMVLAASVIIFLRLRLGTGDPALDYLRLSNLPPTPEMLASTRTMLGLVSRCTSSMAPGYGRRCILTLVSHSPANARCWTIC